MDIALERLGDQPDSAWQLKLECTRTEFQSQIGPGYILSTHEEVALMRETTTSFFAVLGG